MTGALPIAPVYFGRDTYATFIFSLWAFCTTSAHAQTSVFGYTGSLQTYIVPSNAATLSVRLWGAGGANVGGSGAFVSGILAVTPGQTLTVIVGGGSGGAYVPNGGGAFGGGSSASISDVLAGSGGGRSGIRLGSDEIVTAGAGGGGTKVTIGKYFAQGGGGGGISEGGTALQTGGEGTGGSQTQGGATNGVGITGSSFQGGNASPFGGGGGGGYFGGGSGRRHDEYGVGGGGGGSSFIANLTGVVAEAGQLGLEGGVLPGGASDQFYVTGVGIGAASGTGRPGGNGRMVISVATIIPESGAGWLALLGAVPLVWVLRRRTAVARA